MDSGYCVGWRDACGLDFIFILEPEDRGTALSSSSNPLTNPIMNGRNARQNLEALQAARTALIYAGIYPEQPGRALTETIDGWWIESHSIALFYGQRSAEDALQIAWWSELEEAERVSSDLCFHFLSYIISGLIIINISRPEVISYCQVDRSMWERPPREKYFSFGNRT